MARSISKSRAQRLEELRRSLVVIETGLRLYGDTRDEAHLISVAGQLRALLARTGQTPLLLDLARELGFPLQFYSLPLHVLHDERWAGILGTDRIQWTGDSLCTEAAGPPYIAVIMEDWLASTQVVVGERKISGEDLVKMVANKLGGAHYDPTLPSELASMTVIELGGVPSHYRTLVRLGEVVVNLGRKLLAHEGGG